MNCRMFGVVACALLMMGCAEDSVCEGKSNCHELKVQEELSACEGKSNCHENLAEMDPSIDAEWWEDSDSGDVDGIISFKLGDPVDYELQCTWNGEGQILIGDGDFRHDIAADSSTEPPSVRCTNSENVVAGIITIQVEKVLTSEYPTERYELKLEITDFLGVDSEEEEFVIPSAIYEETIQFSYETTGSDV